MQHNSAAILLCLHDVAAITRSNVMYERAQFHNLTTSWQPCWLTCRYKLIILKFPCDDSLHWLYPLHSCVTSMTSSHKVRRVTSSIQNWCCRFLFFRMCTSVNQSIHVYRPFPHCWMRLETCTVYTGRMEESMT